MKLSKRSSAFLCNQCHVDDLPHLRSELSGACFGSPMARPMAPEVIENPPLPFWGIIPGGGLQPEMLIEIHGFVNHGAQRFHIDFSKGVSRDNCDIALHFNPRFDQRIIVRNSYTNGSWKNEEREPNSLPLSVGKDFVILFLVQSTQFKIAVNSRHYTDFHHRVPFNKYDKLNIEGNIRVKKIEYSYQSDRPTTAAFNPFLPVKLPPQICPAPYVPMPSDTLLQPVFNPATPFKYQIPGGLRPGMMIYISGRPSANATRFDIDLRCASTSPRSPDISFHFNPRFDPAIVVRNTRINDRWGSEEKFGGFPFNRGAHFDLIINVEGRRIMVAVNGRHFIEYVHRVQPLSISNTLAIEGDIIISCVKFQL